MPPWFRETFVYFSLKSLTGAALFSHLDFSRHLLTHPSAFILVSLSDLFTEGKPEWSCTPINLTISLFHLKLYEDFPFHGKPSCTWSWISPHAPLALCSEHTPPSSAPSCKPCSFCAVSLPRMLCSPFFFFLNTISSWLPCDLTSELP